VIRLKQTTTLDPIPHLTCVCHGELAIEEILTKYAQAGVSNTLALGGDPPRELVNYDRTADAFQHAADLVSFIRRFNERGGHPNAKGFGIGVAGFPEGHPSTPNRLEELDHLKAKIDAGAYYICTQLALGARFPAKLLRALGRASDDPEAVKRVGVHWATEQCRDLLDNQVRGIHFYTLNKSDATRQIYQSLGLRDSLKLRRAPGQLAAD
jgi:methylenetetrahydrofolate reductase (NADPH)